MIRIVMPYTTTIIYYSMLYYIVLYALGSEPKAHTVCVSHTNTVIISWLSSCSGYVTVNTLEF